MDEGAENPYKKQILDALEENSQKMRSTEKFFGHYSKIADELMKERSRAPSVSGVAGDSALAEEAQRVRRDLEALTKEKSKNDQDLISANRKVGELESEISATISEKCDLEDEIDELRKEKKDLADLIDTLQVDAGVLNDERLALTASCKNLASQVQEMESDRIKLINKVRELNEKYAEFMNAEVVLDEERRQQRIQEEIARAIEDTSHDVQTTSLLSQIPDYVADAYCGDILPSRMRGKIQTNEGEVNEVHWLPNNTFASGGSDRYICIWRIDGYGAYTKISTLTGCNAAITRIDYDAEKSVLLASSNDKNVRIWNINTQRLMATMSGHTDKVATARFCHGNQVISGSFDQNIKIWDVSSQTCSRTFAAKSTVLDVVGRPAGHASFVSGHIDKTVRFWDGRSREAFKTYDCGNRVTSLDLSTDGTRLLCSTRDDTLCILDVRNYQVVHYYSAEQYHTSSDLVRCVLSPGGEYVAAGSSSGFIFVWKTESTRLEKVLRNGNDNAIMSLSWNPTGNGLLSSDRQKTVVCWD